LRCGNQGEVNAVPHNLEWEKWYLEEQDDGTVCILSQQWNKYVQISRQGDGFKTGQQNRCGSWERFTLNRIADFSGVVPGHYRVKSVKWNHYLSNPASDQIEGIEDNSEVWNVRFNDAGVYSF